jgi:hypothetical protein
MYALVDVGMAWKDIARNNNDNHCPEQKRTGVIDFFDTGGPFKDG